MADDERLPRPSRPDDASGEQISFIRALGHTVRVSQRGTLDGGAPPLLLLMGLGGNIEMWEPLRTELTNRGVTTLAIDVPGTGESPPPTLPLPLAVHALIVLAVLRRLEIQRVDVMGLSWGGLLAQHLALTARRRVRRVVLVSTNFGVGSMLGNYRTIKAMLTVRRYLSADEMAFAAAAFGGDIDVARPDHPHTAARFARPPSKRGYYWQLLSPVGWSSLPWLWLMPQPTYIVCGDDDLAVPLVNARILARLIPHSKLEIIANGGHLAAFERPTEVAISVAAFLGSMPSKQDGKKGPQ